MAQMKNSTLLIGIGAIAVVALLLSGVISIKPGGEPSVVPTVPETAGQPGAVEVGKSATLEVAAFNDQADSATQVALATGMYAWKNGVLIMNGGALVADDRLDINAATGDELTLIAFDSTYPYAKPQTTTIKSETQFENLAVSDVIAGGNLQIKYYYDGAVLSAPETVTMGADEVLALDDISLKINTNNAAFNLGAVCFDTITDSNISNIDVNGLTKITVPERIDNTVDYCYEAPEQLLTEWETFKTGNIEITADSDNPAENVTVYVIDKAPYIKIDQTLGFGYETDETSPSDVGLADITDTLVIA